MSHQAGERCGGLGWILMSRQAGERVMWWWGGDFNVPSSRREMWWGSGWILMSRQAGERVMWWWGGGGILMSRQAGERCGGVGVGF